LVNSFMVEADRDEAFTALWSKTSAYFRQQPGYMSLRLHRALSPASDYRYINVARWASAEQFAAAHDTDEFRRLGRADRLARVPVQTCPVRGRDRTQRNRAQRCATDRAEGRPADGPALRRAGRGNGGSSRPIAEHSPTAAWRVFEASC
jgi:heme-degrading monooxygenase HmoA